jgi:type III pantothenate kinase
MILAIDAGNTRTKWGVFDDQGLLVEQGVADNLDPNALGEQFKTLQGLRRVVVSNVAGEAVAKRIARVLAGLNLSALWVKPQATACGVSNGYQVPETLGSDRWAALIAAWNTYHAPCVVVNAGTAMTVDALTGQGEFLGGLILPSLGLMRVSLATGTAKVAPAAGNWRDFPNSTADAVQTGTLAAMAGAVRHMVELLEMREARAPVCVLSGGDAEALAPALAMPTIQNPHLVLHGLLLLEKTTV